MTISCLILNKSHIIIIIMNKYTRLILLILIFNITTPLWSDLGGFKEDVEREEEENSKKENIENIEEDEEENIEEDEDSFFSLLWDMTFLLWLYHNDSSYYSRYPYEIEGMENGANFINHDNRSEKEKGIYTKKFKEFFFTIYGSPTINETADTFGGQLRFTGKVINHFGPELEYRLLWNEGDFLHNLSGGMNLSIFQFDPLALDFYIKAVFFMGIMERIGVSLGGRIMSYPFRPVSLEFRGGVVIFPSITFAEIGAKLGFHIDAVELFGDFYMLRSEQSQLYSIGLGIGYHF